MTSLQPKTLSEITHQALRILSKQLGVPDTLRFISQYTTGYGDYTEERRELFGEMSLDDILSEMKAQRENTRRE